MMWFILFAVLAFGPPLYLWATSKGDVSVTLADHQPNNRTLFVHLPGLMGDGVTQIENIRDVFAKRGDLLAVHYDGEYGKSATAFDQSEVVKVVAHAIAAANKVKQYSAIIFIGTSMGGKLAFATAQSLKHVSIRTKVVLVDAPLGVCDLRPPLNMAPVLRVLPFIPVLNLFLFAPLMKVMVQPPKATETDEDLTAHERDSLDESVAEARKTTTPFWRDQVLSIVKPLDRDDESPWGPKDVVYLWSKGDNDTVREQARDSWSELLGFEVRRLQLSRAKHCAYGQNPSRYRLAFPQAFELLGLK